jgi:hypothetical protein
MGYSTDFKGELKFKEELPASELAEVKKFLDEDSSDHPEWGNIERYYVDLEFLNDFSGLKWNGAEKTYGMVQVVNMIINNMIEHVNSDFGFTGELQAQGEDMDDRWVLLINDEGMAEKKDIVVTGNKVICPHCKENFIIG